MKKILTLFICLTLLWACVDDKGNYDYQDIDEVTISVTSQIIEALSHSGRIQINPTITSKNDGIITESNKNYTIKYKLGYKGMGYLAPPDAWVDLNPNGEFNLDVPADFDPTTYICWIVVTDTRTNVAYSTTVEVKIGSTTYEGWMVLCNEGSSNKARLDMISIISQNETIAVHNLASGMPEIHNATGLGFFPTNADPGTEIFIFSQEGSYSLDNEKLTSSGLNEFNLNQFITMPGNGTEIVNYFHPIAVNGNASYTLNYSFCITDAGNAYSIDNLAGGAVFEFPINVDNSGDVPTYRVAPQVGVGEVRPGNTDVALFYDIDNKRFMGWKKTSYQTLSTISDPGVGQLFSYQTGKDFVYMEGTARSNGLVYAILQNATGQRSLYTINMAGNGFVQEDYIDNITAPDFNQAEHFAFHSKFPLMFYSVGSKLYMYNLGSKTAMEMNTGLESTENITLLKFNLYKTCRPEILTNQTQEFMDQQYDLIVGSYNSSSSNDNGGKVTFFGVDNTNITKKYFYDGFAKVQDVVYRERFN